MIEMFNPGSDGAEDHCDYPRCGDKPKWFQYFRGMTTGTIHRSGLCGYHKKKRYRRDVTQGIYWVGRIP